MNKQTKTLLWGAGIIVVILILARILIPIIFELELPYAYPHMFTPMMFPIGMFAMILFWGVVVYLVYKLLIQDKSSKNDDGLAILKNRLSKGEISIEEYETLKKALKEDK